MLALNAKIFRLLLVNFWIQSRYRKLLNEKLYIRTGFSQSSKLSSKIGDLKNIKEFKRNNNDVFFRGLYLTKKGGDRMCFPVNFIILIRDSKTSHDRYSLHEKCPNPEARIFLCLD